MSQPNVEHVLRIAQEHNIKVHQIATTAQLLAEGATVPFIARYRKEATGELDEVQITAIRDRLEQLAALDERRASITASLKERNLLTDDLAKKIAAAETLNTLEDIYQPFRPKKRTRATIAKEKGLEPLADLLQAQDPATNAETAAAEYAGREYTPDDGKNTPAKIKDAAEALAGARDIIAERISDDAPTRARLRALYTAGAIISSKIISGKETEAAKFKDYFEWSEPLAKAPSHRVLAMRRGEKELFLMMRITVDETAALAEITPLHVGASQAAPSSNASTPATPAPATPALATPTPATPPSAKPGAHIASDTPASCAHHIRLALADSYKRLLAPAMETEMRLDSKKRADETAIKVFAENLRELLLAPPLGQKNTLAIDPGFRTGCKVVILDRQGKLLHNDVVYPDQGAARNDEAVEKIKGFTGFFKIEAIAIGNGTAGRETETFIRDLGLPKNIPIVMVNESGASIYSASEVAREEFPDHDITVRGAVSIGRRLMDPLAELVKLDPKSIGVGQYQHDVDQNALKRALDDCVISSVNGVGVEVNTASKQLLSYVSGLNAAIAANIVTHRNENGPFKTRAELLKVSRLGPKAYEQAAGFLRIRGAENPLDASAVHPESYGIVEKMAADLGVTVADLMHDEKLRKKIALEKYVTDKVGLPTLTDIVNELAKPGRDPRQKFETFSFQEGINKLEDLKPGMKLPGIVTNVTAFGAFVDIGVHQEGLLHVSQLADTFVRTPAEVVKVSQRVMVTVMDVDLVRNRIALSMRANPQLGARAGGNPGKAISPRPPVGGPTSAPRRDSTQSLGGDWFTAALNKKK
ncbi:MAG: RNA-binding transcriptional accessory protein [Opitutaceae bacterium]|nr:RNA-binding transcriptional accessory protein [Opitutaceae bacterium]